MSRSVWLTNAMQAQQKMETEGRGNVSLVTALYREAISNKSNDCVFNFYNWSRCKSSCLGLVNINS